MSLPPEIADAMNKAVKSGKLKSIEDIEEFVFELIMEYNKRSQPDMCNLSPLQVQRLLQSDWESKSSALQLNNRLNHRDLAPAPIYQNARLFMKRAAESPIKATAAGNLNRGFVRLMLKNMFLEKDYKDIILKTYKVINEGDVWTLHVLRHVLSLSGIIQKRKGNFILSKKGIGLLSKEVSGSLYALIFRTYFKKFNLAYLDNMPLSSPLQDTIAYAFYVLHKISGKWYSPDKLKDIIWLEAVKSEIVQSDINNYLLWQTETRVVRPLIAFGLLDRKDKGVNDKFIKKYIVKKSRLFYLFLKFDF